MENTVNERVLMLKTHFNLNNLEFCTKADISIGSMSNIQNGGNLSSKLLRNICEAFNANKDWLLTGKGKMFNESKTNAGGAENPYKDALVAELKQANERLIEQNKWFQQLVNQLTGGLKPNFRKAAEKAIMLMSANNKQLIAKA